MNQRQEIINIRSLATEERMDIMFVLVIRLSEEQVYCRPNIIVCSGRSSGRREFPQKKGRVSRPDTLATSRGGKTSRGSCELEMIYRVKRVDLVRIMRDKLTLTSGYLVR